MTKLKTIIVGGGISGIKAALELQKGGIDYVILEAKDRLGGRLKTVQGLNWKYDLGASWFHETLNNPLFDEEIRNKDQNSKTKIIYEDSLVEIINEKGKVPKSLKLEAISDEIHKYVELESYKDLEKDISLYAVTVKYLKERKDLLTNDQISTALEYVRSLELWHGIDIQKLSAKYSSIDNFGRDAFAIHYESLLERHTKQLDPSKVNLKSIVKSIKKNPNSQISVTLTSGETHEGDYVIITVPQSILQLKEGENGFINFEPPLPKSLRESLENVHFGALGKIILEFDQVFWSLESERILSLATPPTGFLESILNNTETPPLPTTENLPQTWQYPVLILNLAKTVQKPSLICLIQSPVTNFLEKNPSQAWSYMKPIIAKLKSPQASIPDPTNVIVTDWTIDPYQQGSYSACFPGDDPLTPIIQFENGFGNVRFAGEHTILEGAGCVHGAWNSGKREADYIIKQSKANSE